MSTQPKDGGTAFPVVGRWVDAGGGASRFEVAPSGGASLRDYFAAKAIGGMLANPDTGVTLLGRETWIQGWAREAYEVADAMLAARGETP